MTGRTTGFRAFVLAGVLSVAVASSAVYAQTADDQGIPVESELVKIAQSKKASINKNTLSRSGLRKYGRSSPPFARCAVPSTCC